jgi:DNA-binding response OmpR family regulator
MAILYRRPGIAESGEVAEEPVSILFLQDDPAVAEMYKLKLELDGYRVTVATQADDAEELLGTHPPDIIYLDIRSAGGRNLARLDAVRSRTDAGVIPVVILSGAPAEELKAQGVQLRPMDYIVRCDTVRTGLGSIAY